MIVPGRIQKLIKTDSYWYQTATERYL